MIHNVQEVRAMAAKVIDGRSLADEVREQVKQEIAELTARGCKPTLCSVRVGDDPSTTLYVRQQQRTCQRLGIEYLATQMPDTSSERAVCTMIDSLNANPAVHGIIVQLPLPEHLDTSRVQLRLAPAKDVEGVHPENIGRLVNDRTDLAPCTASAVLQLIESTGVELRGAEACVVGAGAIAGKPISLLLSSRMATTTLCHIATRDLALHTKKADILVVAVGKAGLISGDMIRPGAVVIDVGINTIDVTDDEGRVLRDAKGKPQRRVVGDIDYDAAVEVAGAITPVPGGVGPMTVAMLMENILRATKLANPA
jgi:methylenetetrahydrofolate dehydrogenase (NADP+)/methenyltetrahydrofolate cyclohydrolase